MALKPGWVVERIAGDPQELHGLGFPQPVRRTLRWCVPVSTAIVIGRCQPLSDVSGASEAGVTVIRRSSGGGAVLVGPDEGLWADVCIPADDPLWEADVGRASWWVGDVWACALAAVGIEGAVVHHGPAIGGSGPVCFAGLGPGELTWRHRKIVGVAQRRTRHGALFQCAVLWRWRPEQLAAAVGYPDLGDLGGRAVGLHDIDPGMGSSVLIDAIEGCLP